MVFDGFRRSFDDLLSRATRPEERRIVASRMKDTLVQARMGLDDLRDGLEKARQRLALEERELETIRRRKQLAEGINDRETVDIAGEVRADARRARRRAAAEGHGAGGGAGAGRARRRGDVGRAQGGHGGDRSARRRGRRSTSRADPRRSRASFATRSIRSGRARAHADREADAARRLDELKRRMGK